MKHCKKCDKTKEISDFYVWKDKPSYICRDCLRGNAKERRIRLRRVFGTSEWWSRQFSTRHQGAKRRGIPFTLTYQQFKEIFIKQECFYCGEKKPPYFHLDRNNNKEGYSKENVRLSCPTCNLKKGEITPESIQIEIEKHKLKIKKLKAVSKRYFF